MFTAISAAVLVGTEIMGAALAAGWALSGLFELGPPFDYILMGLCGIGGLTLALADTHRRLLERAEAMGLGDHDNSAVILAMRGDRP